MYVFIFCISGGRDLILQDKLDQLLIDQVIIDQVTKKFHELFNHVFCAYKLLKVNI
jgi:hypothetical protein